MGRSMVWRGDGEAEGGSVGGVQPEVLADRTQCGETVPSDAEIGRWRSPVAFVADVDAYGAQAAVLADQLELVGDGTGCAIAVAVLDGVGQRLAQGELEVLEVFGAESCSVRPVVHGAADLSEVDGRCGG